MPCECSQVYSGQMGHSTDIRLKEHQHHFHLEHPDKSAVAEHSINLGHNIKLQNTCTLIAKTTYMDRVIRDASEIELHSTNVNREDGFCLSKSWKPIMCPLRDHRKPSEYYDELQSP
jgi:hypothetical protein